MSITISIEDGTEYAKLHDLVGKVYDPCECGGDVDCLDCKGTGKIGYDNYPFELNLANGNFSLIWSSLGMDIDDCCGWVDANELIRAVQTCRPELVTRAPKEVSGDGKARMFTPGLSVDYAYYRLNTILDIATEAARRGKKVVWG